MAALAAGALLACLADGAVAAPTVVADVHVEGNKRLSREAVLTYVKIRVGEPYDDAIVKADVRRLLESRQFDSAVATRTPTDRGIVVTFSVTERPLVAAIEFLDNKAFDEEELRKELGFAVGDPVDIALVRAGRDAIARKYQGAGYFEAMVVFDEIILELRNKVIYRVREGAHPRIRALAFRGNEFFSSFWLRQRIETTRRLWPFLSGNIDMELIDKDVQTIRDMYVEEGFLAVEVGRLLEFSEDKESATLTVVIREGQRFRVGRVTFEGNALFSDEQLARRLVLRAGVFYTPLKLARDVSQVQGAYGELGYIESGVQAREVFREDEGVVDISFIVHESEQFLVGRIEIRGNTVTEERVIRRLLRFYPDQRFDTTAMQQARARLLETQLFREAVIRPVGEAPGVRNVLVRVEEKETAHFMIGAGVSTDHGLVGSITVEEQNFNLYARPKSFAQLFRRDTWRGAGQLLRVAAYPGVEVTRFNVSWQEPYLCDRPYSLGVQAFLYERERESYNETRYGAAVTVGHRFKNRWQGEVAVRPEGVRIDNLDATAPPELVALRGDHVLYAVKASLIRDRTDSTLSPSTGDRLRVSYEQVFGDFDFGRASASYAYYYTVYMDALDRKHVLKVRVAVNAIAGEAPVFERFYGGGANWIRGFAYRGISPRSPGTTQPIGGDFAFFLGGEYEFPLFDKQVRGVVFLDTGTVEESCAVTTYRASAGFGFRWFVPFLGPVPITFDFGFPISKDPLDNTQVFNFNIGWSF